MQHQASSLKEVLLSDVKNRSQTDSHTFLSRERIFARLPGALASDLTRAGFEADSISTEARVGLSGAYGLSSRHWDLILLEDDLPVAMVEIKTMVPFRANNLRNRIDELVAVVTSLARTFDGPDRAPFRPCIAIVLAIEDSEITTRPRTKPAPALSFPGDLADDERSYIDLMAATFAQLRRDGLVDAACLLAVDTERGEVREPFPDQSFSSFVSTISTYIVGAGKRRAGGAVGAASLGRALSRGDDVQEVVSGITSTPEGLSAIEVAVVRERRRIVAALQQLALEEGVNETKIHEAIGERYWIFGGQYVGVAPIRSIVTLDQYDIPLICADSSLEIVELKGPEVRLAKRHRNHLIVSNDVHAAVNQCLNYLRSLDESGAMLSTLYRNELGIDFDFRRARGTVVVGHPGRSTSPEPTRQQIEQTIRSYNSHLSRIRVVTYADLLESAERALQFESEKSSKAAPNAR